MTCLHWPQAQPAESWQEAGLPDRIQNPLEIPPVVNDASSTDFMADALWSGRRFRTFNVADHFNRECLKIEIDTGVAVGARNPCAR